VLAIGCSKREVPPPAPTPASTPAAAPADKIEGMLTIDGAPVPITACRPGHGVSTFVELVTAAGTLRFENKQLSWNGEVLACTKLDRSWGGGTRPDGTAYWRGTLRFECDRKSPRGGDRASGDITVDCGGITPTERAQLDANRKDMLDEQRRSQ
jgi:hypothetical protein